MKNIINPEKTKTFDLYAFFIGLFCAIVAISFSFCYILENSQIKRVDEINKEKYDIIKIALEKNWSAEDIFKLLNNSNNAYE
jgi:hypothetical protein